MERSRGIPAARATTHIPLAPGTGRRALVTGASGFIGRHLVRRLLRDGWEVAVTVRATSRVPEDVAQACAQIDAEAAFEEFAFSLERFQPDTCFHLATWFSNGHDSADIDMMIESNVTFGVRVLEALTRCGGATVVNAGSRMQHYLGEQYRPVSLYAATKQSFMDVLRYYADIQQLPSVTVEFPDTYGPDDPRQKLLSLLQRSAGSGNELAMSPGDQLIEILHVDDAVEALLTAQTSAEPTAPTFSATGTTMPLRSFVSEVEQALGQRVPIRWGARPYRDREMMSPWAHWPVLPGWAPTVELRTGLAATLSPRQAALLSR